MAGFVLAITAIFVVAFPTMLNRVCKLVLLILAKRSTKVRKSSGELLEYLPRVVIQIAISNEPPEIVQETLISLEQLDYPRFVVQVIDNNTTDTRLWKPIEDFCNQRPDRFVFFHVEKLEGFKAGALQYGLERIAPDVELIGIVDADNVVDARFLRDVVPFFKDPSVGIVQTPLGFLRDPGKGGFTSWIYLIYRYYLSIYMPACHRFRCAPFIGGMGILRREALETVGGWDGFYLTEDMELSGRLFRAGYCSHFVDVHYGRTMPPANMQGFKKQHYRWNFGNTQILRDYLLPLLTRKRSGNGGWLRRMLHMCCPGVYFNIYFLPFIVIALAVRIAELSGYSGELTAFICHLMLFLLAVEFAGEAIIFVTLGWSERAGIIPTLKNYIAWWSLSYNNSLSTWTALFQRTRPFEITDKNGSRHGTRLKSVLTELSLCTLLVSVAVATPNWQVVSWTFTSPLLLCLGAICGTPCIIALSTTRKSTDDEY